MRRTLPLLASLIVLALLVTAVPASARSQIAIGVANPAGGGPKVAGVIEAVEAHRADVGRYPAMWSLWSKWGDGVSGPSEACEPNVDACAFPSEAVAWLQSKGIMPVIWWLPMDPKDQNSNLYGRYKRILAGKHDAYIKQWARDARDAGTSSGQPVMVRFAHEATGHWFPWSIGRKDNTRQNYKQAWNYIGRKFKAQGADPHVRWLWANVWPFAWAYPGDKFVDYVGVTVLNFGSDRKWKPAKGLIDKRGAASRAFTRRPVIVAELGTHWKGGDKGAWIREAYMRSYKKHPYIKGITYLETDEPHIQRGHPDWRLEVGDDGAGLTTYQNLASMWKFKGKIK